MRDPKEQALLERLQSGDERALSDLAEAYGSKIFQLAFRYLKNKEDAEEITQDVLFKVYRNVGAFRGDAALSSWIYRITFNAAMSRLRTAAYQRAQAEDRQAALADNDQSRTTQPREPADWTNMADESVLRVAAAEAPVRRDSRAAGDLSGAGDAARHPGDVGRGGQCGAAREGSDAQVAPAPRALDPAQAARRFRRRPVAAPADLRNVGPKAPAKDRRSTQRLPRPSGDQSTRRSLCALRSVVLTAAASYNSMALSSAT